MPFGVVSGVSRGMGVLDGEGVVWGEFGVSHCDQWGLCDAALPKLLWQWRFYVGARGAQAPKSCPGPQINTGQLDTAVLLWLM